MGISTKSFTKHPYLVSTLLVLVVGGFLAFFVSSRFDLLLTQLIELSNHRPLVLKELSILFEEIYLYTLLAISITIIILNLIVAWIISIIRHHNDSIINAPLGSASLLRELNDVKQQLLIQDKMASVGMLTGGIAHEIKNPLNFVNNFSDMSLELITELGEGLESVQLTQDKKNLIDEILNDLTDNLKKINEHGHRADSIVKHILMQSHSEELTKRDANINKLLDEYLNLAYHGMRAQNSNFNITIKSDYDKSMPLLKIAEQNIGRVFLNIINNGLYAAHERAKNEDETFKPTIEVCTSHSDRWATIKITDNGSGIPKNVKEKIFEPFFTTKPIGVGTGLGLHICHDIIIKQHSGKIDIITEKGKFTTFIIMLPISLSNSCAE